MREIVHRKIVENAAQISNSQFGEVILRNRYWLETNVAGRICDTVLRDYLYHTLPRSIQCIRKLTAEILSTNREDELKISFLINWVSHYISDSLWVGHFSKKYLKEEEIEELESVIEAKLEVEYPKEKVKTWLRGYWSGFWYTILLMDNYVKEHAEMKISKEYRIHDYHIENVRLCIKTFASYLRYLDFISENKCLNDLMRDRNVLLSKYGKIKKIYCVNDGIYKQNILPIIIDLALSNKVETSEIFTSYFDEADLIIDSTPLTPPINIKKGKIVISGNDREIGSIIDFFLDLVNAKFGTSNKVVLNSWVGNHLLQKNWNGEQLQRNVYTSALRMELSKLRGYIFLPKEEKAEEKAIIEKERKEMEEKLFTETWSKALNKFKELGG